MQPPHQRPIRKIVARKNVYVDALMDKRVFRMIFFDAGRMVSAQLGKLHGPVRAVFPLHIVALRIKVPRRLRKQAVIFAAHEDHIHIIVPRDEAVVTNGAQRRSGEELIGYMVLTAHGVKVLEHLQQERLMRSQNLHFSHG